MPEIGKEASLVEVATIVSDALQTAGFAATLSGGSAVSIGHLEVDHEDCAVIKSEAGELRIVTPTQCVMDRLAAAFAWIDVQSRDQAVRVAANQVLDWDALRTWFANEGVPDPEFERFQSASRST